MVAEQSFNRLAALKQEARGASSVVPSLLAVEPCCLNEVTTPEPSFKFPLRTLKELNKGICSDESLYNKLLEFLTKIKPECDEMRSAY